MSKNKLKVNDHVRLHRKALKGRLLDFVDTHQLPLSRTLDAADIEVLDALIESYVFKEPVEGVVRDYGAIDEDTGLYYLRVDFDVGLPWEYQTIVEEEELKLIERPA